MQMRSGQRSAGALGRRGRVVHRVQRALDEIRPALQADGGDVQLVQVVDRTVYLRFRGVCQACPMATQTLREGIEAWVRRRVPEIAHVERADQKVAAVGASKIG